MVARPSSYPAPFVDSGAHLSGRVVGQLAPGEQFVLWALRQRLRDGEEPSGVLLDGYLEAGRRRREPGESGLLVNVV